MGFRSVKPEFGGEAFVQQSLDRFLTASIRSLAQDGETPTIRRRRVKTS